jgi:hypothetical protein
MRAGKTIVGVTAATVGVILAGGCQLIAGVREGQPYPADAGTTGTGGEGGGAGASTTGSGGATSCAPGSKIDCYSGPDGTKGVGICQAGKKSCRMDGSGYDACVGEVKPKAESCAAKEDENCDGHDCVQWAELFGDDASQLATGAAVDSHGNIYATGAFYGAIHFGNKTLISAGEADIFVLKLSPDGKPIWGQQFGDGSLQDNSLVAVDASDNVFVTGRSPTPISLGGALVPAGLFVAKLDSDGKYVWGKGLTTNAGCTGSDSNINGLATTLQGDVVLGGYYCGTIDFGEGLISSDSVSRDGFVAKLKGADGTVNAADQTWGKVFGQALSQELDGIAVDSAGSVLMAGTFSGSMSLGPGDFLSSTGGSDAFIAKLTPAGLPSWHVKLGDGADQAMVAIAVDSTGGPIVTGTFEGTVDFGGNKITKGTSFIAKYDSDGAYKWNNIITTTAVAASVALDSDGNAIVAGIFSGSVDLGKTPLNATGPGLETFVAKLSAAGTLSWIKRFGDSTDLLGAGASVAITGLGEPILVGRVAGPIDFGTGTLTPAGEVDVFVAKLSP